MVIASRNQQKENENEGNKVGIASIAKPFLFIIVLWIVFIFCSKMSINFFNIVYFALLIVNTVIISLVMDRELINERADITQNYQKGDLFYAAIIGRLGPLLIVITSGLDNRFSWTNEYSQYLNVVALIGVLIGLLISDWAVITNKFFSAVVRIQKERNHIVITGGPYTYVRHPGYLGSIIYNLLTPLVLNSIWGILPALCVMVVSLLRIKREEEYLQKELVGYNEYSEQVKYRLFPCLW